MSSARKVVKVPSALDKDWGRGAVAACGLPLSALAKRCGIPKKRLYAATHGGDPFTAEECAAMSSALGIPRDRSTFCGEQLADALARETMRERPASTYVRVKVRKTAGASDVAVGWVMRVASGDGESEVACGDVRSRDTDERVMTIATAERVLRERHGVL